MSAHNSKSRRWSQRVTESSVSLDLAAGVFAMNDPAQIARSLKRSAERSLRQILEAAKDELRAIVARGSS